MDGVALGVDEAGQIVEISSQTLRQHLYVLGTTGTGKSELLAQIALAHVHAGEGVIVLDPHGDLIQDIACRVPLAHGRLAGRLPERGRGERAGAPRPLALRSDGR